MSRFVAWWSAAIVTATPSIALAAGVTVAEGKAYISDRVTWPANASPQIEPSGGAIMAAGEGGTGRRNVTPAGALAVTTSIGWIGSALDYGVAPATTGALPSLEIRRYHNYRAIVFPSSFGHGGFSGYDITLTLHRVSATSGAMTLFDPRDLGPRNLSDLSSTGLYVDAEQDGIEGAQLLDATSSPVADQALAATARLVTRDGFTYSFDVIRTSPSPGDPGRFGRLTRIADRNDNAITIAYEAPAGASDAELGFDRERLWKITSVTDAHGRTAAFTYAATKQAGRWAVSRIDLPNGTSVHYSYQDNGLVGLSGVAHPDGSTTTLTATPDAPTQSLVLHVDDAAAEGTNRRRDVYLTSSTWVDPVSHAVSSQPAFLARMIVNGAGEVVYLNRSSQSLSAYTNTYWVYEGGGSFFRYTTDVAGAPVRAEQAIGWSLGDDPNSYAYQLIASYKTLHRRVTSVTDARNRVTTYSRDTLTGAVKKTTYPDGSSESATYNAFRQPLTTTDGIGRLTAYSYDARGNLLSKTAAVGTPAQATQSFTYNTRGQPLTATDANGNVTAYAYSPEGDLASVTEPPDVPGGPRAVTSYAYDAAGRVTSVTDPRGRVTAYGYDARNRVTAVQHHDGTVETTLYGAGADANLVVERTDRLGYVTRYAYDAAGREVQRVSAFGRPEAVVRTCSYVSGTTLESNCSDRGERTAYTYDEYNRRVATTEQPSTAAALTSSTSYDNAGRIAFTTDAYGRRTFYAYDLRDRVIRTVRETAPGALAPPPQEQYGYLLRLPRVLSDNAGYLITEAAYDRAGQAISRTDGRGLVETFAYDGQGRMIRSVEAAGTPAEARTEHDYDPQGNRIATRRPRHFTEPGGFVTLYGLTGRNLLASRVEAAGRPEQVEERYAYDLDRRQSLRVDARGNSWSTVWSQRRGDHLAEIEPPANDGGDEETSAVRAEVRDSLGRVTHAFVAPDASALGSDGAYDDPPVTLRETTTRYDGLGRPIATTVWLAELGAVDPNDPPIAGDPGYPASGGLTTRWVYDDDLTDGVGLDAVHAVYLGGLGLGSGSDGSAVETTNPAGEKSLTVHDGMGREVRTVRLLGGVATSVVASTVYDAVVSGTPGAPGALVETRHVAYPGGLLGAQLVTRSRRDAAARELATVDAEGQFSLRAYDANGNVVGDHDPNGSGEVCLFDARNRVTACTDAKGDATQSAYDASGNVVARVDGIGSAAGTPAGHTTTHAYDGLDRRVATIDRLGGITRRLHDPNGNVIELEDAEGRVTEFVHDARDRLIEEIFPGGGPKVVDHLAYLYDAAGRRIARYTGPNDVVVDVHDRADRVITRTYPDGMNDTFVHDPASRLLTAISARHDNTVSRSYDAAGRLTGETITVSGQSLSTGYGYDAADRKTSIVYPDGKVLATSFTARGQIDTLTYDGSLVVHRVYDPGMRLVATTYGNGAVETRTYGADDLPVTISTPGVTGLSYSYDANKNPLGQGNSVDPGDAQSYAYDAEDRLESFTRAAGSAQSWDLSLEGDWLAFTANGATDERSYNPAHGVVEACEGTIHYDLRGLPLEHAGQALSWDVDHRLRRVGSTVMSYDALGRRVRATTGKVGAVVFAYDGRRGIAEADAGGDVRATFAFGDAPDEVLMMAADGSRHYAHSNRLGSVQALTDDAGALVEARRYDPYGATIVMSDPGADGVWFTGDEADDAGLCSSGTGVSAVGMPYGYTGQRQDESGLHYYKNRYYSAALGRFLERDPIGYEGGSSNLYEYVGAQPLSAVDPEGTTAFDVLASKWPNGFIPYTLDTKMSARGKSAVKQALADISTATCTRWVQRSRSGGRSITIQEDERGAFSLTFRGGASPFDASETLQHEFVHSLGFYHEQSKPPRNHDLEIDWSGSGTKNDAGFMKAMKSPLFSQGRTIGFTLVDLQKTKMYKCR